MIIPYKGKVPKIHASVFLAEGAHIIGDVEIGEDSSVWFNAVIRGDVNFVRIGERTNVQDNCVLHVTHDRYPLSIGSSVTIGHAAIVHGATVGNYCLIGMGARVLDNARIGDYALVAAGALVLEGFEVPPGTLVAGVPAKVRRDLTPLERESIVQSAQNYVKYMQSYRQ
ncbi:MAG TPA: gamma carbonic anhydrase family protein [Bacteroidota bacterium]|nr:gamma carbonic anhydrase family protein [Bacteroidota bacterium]